VDLFWNDPINKYSNSDKQVLNKHSHSDKYSKPPTISPGLIYFCKRFMMGLYRGGLIHGQSFVLVINKSGINKSVIDREINMY
jgi:hypothetical protein